MPNSLEPVLIRELDEADALVVANRTEYGLVAGVRTSGIGRAAGNDRDG